jgi:hypothetical protein
MTLDQQLRDELREVVDRAGELSLDLTEVMAAGAKGRAVQRRRTRFKWVGVAAAAAAAVVAVPVILGGLGPDEQPPVIATEPGPPLTAADVPYVKDGVIHVGGATIESPYGDLSPRISYANGTAIIWSPLSPKGEMFPAYRLVDGVLDELPASTAATPTISPDGRTVVWADHALVDEGVKNQVTFDTVSLYVADAETGQVSRELPMPGTGSTILVGADNQGRVFFGDEQGDWIWQPDGGLVPFDWKLPEDGPASIMSTTSDGIFVDVSHFPNGGGPAGRELYTLSVAPDGTVGVRHDLPSAYGVLSPDGSQYAYVADDAVWVFQVETGKSQRLAGLEGEDETNVGPGPVPSDGWAGDFVVLDLIPNDADTSSRVACDVPAGTCEIQQY